MANTASRLSANGSLTISGSFDELTGGISTNGLVAYLDAGRLESYPGYGNKWIDLSGNNNDGTIVGNVKFVANGTSSYFNWQTQADYNYIAGANAFNYQDCTIVFYADPNGQGFVTPLAAGYPNGQPDIDKSLRILSTGSSTPWWLLNSGDYNDWSSNNVPTQNTIFYLNGSVAPPLNRDVTSKAIQINTGTWNILGGTRYNTAFPNPWKYFIGASGTTGFGGRGWLGRIAAVLLYNRPITASEQIKNYNYFAQRFGIANTKPTVSQVTANSITQSISYQTNGFDEVTYNPSSNNNVNLVQWSQDYTQSVWYKAGSSVTGNAAMAPDGTMTANQLIVNNGGTNGWLDIGGYTPAFKANTPYTFSVYAKAGNASPSQFYILLYNTNFSNRTDINVAARFDLATGVAFNEGGTSVNSVGITFVGDGWYRCWMTATAAKNYPAGTSTQVIRTVYTTVGQYMYFWGYQIEQATSPSIYVRTGANAIIANTFNQRTVNTGNTYIRGNYDEVTGTLGTTNGLVAYFDAAKSESYPETGTTWFDLTPNKLNAIPSGSTPPVWDYSTSSFSYQAGKLTQQPLVLPLSTLLNSSSFSFEIWVKQREFNVNNEYNNQLFGREVYLTSGFRCGVISDGRPRFWTDQSGGTLVLNSSIYTTLNKFYQLVVTYDSSTSSGKMYVNGVSAASATGTISIPTSVPLGVGAGVGGTYDQIGNVGSFIIYNRAISQQEVIDNYNAQRTRYGI